MSRRSLRPQLNQIRIWVQQGRTDAWIAHQLEVSASELREFRRQHELSPDSGDDSSPGHDLRDEIEAEIEAAAAADEARQKAEEEEAAKRKAEEDSRRKSEADSPQEDSDSSGEEADGGEAEARPRSRRRRGRRGRRNQLEGTFDHGEDGFGLWLDPAIQDIQNYTEHWADQREVTVTVERDQIVIRRVGDSAESGDR
ncbi:MAG: hypothetical protein M9938_05740 [Solirubrobacterales bacterium]|nr:hypothetical protein [Solirubrobacterales bacterium]